MLFIDLGALTFMGLWVRAYLWRAVHALLDAWTADTVCSGMIDNQVNVPLPREKNTSVQLGDEFKAVASNVQQ